jgi:hypothetical protein
LLADVFERFVKKSSISVMARATMEHALTDQALDALFREHADRQYTRELLFSFSGALTVIHFGTGS